MKPSPELAHTLTILRGLLAEPSGSEDDPYRRVILRPATDQKQPALQLDAPAAGVSADDQRAQLKGKLTAQSAPLAAISIRGAGTWQIDRAVASPALPLTNKIAVVTGAAGAIGAGVCRGLLESGACVAATDVVEQNLTDLVDDLGSVAADRVIGARLDVTDPASVANAFAEVALTWGGIDLVVVNAGIAMVASLVDLDLEAFRKLERVNVDGTLLTLAEAARGLTRQGTGGDIIVVSTKNVFAPGAQFGAYSATKAASHQLARIASLELAPQGIRVNMVAPDAVFSDGKRRSGLWAEVGPSRMKARGLDEKGLEEYYRGRNLLKARVTARHVANAVLFFATRQTPTTGATIPVDGGLPDATPR